MVSFFSQIHVIFANYCSHHFHCSSILTNTTMEGWSGTCSSKHKMKRLATPESFQRRHKDWQCQAELSVNLCFRGIHEQFGLKGA